MIELHIDFGLLFLSSFFCFGWNYCIEYDNIFGFLRRAYYSLRSTEPKHKIKDDIVNFFTKPLFDCIICMASVYGSLFYFIFTPFHLTKTYFITWAVAVVALAGLNRLLKSFT